MSELTTIIRVHSPACFAQLSEALFSLNVQNFSGIRVVVAAQSLSPEAAAELRSICDANCRDSVDAIDIIHENAERDIRSRLLNVGIKASNTRFLAFLDYDDVIYPDCYRRLVDRLKRADAAIAFGRVVSSFFECIGDTRYIRRKAREFVGTSVYDLAVDNFCPIHSYVIDTGKVERQDLFFEESMSVLEDYDFLLRLIAKYPADFHCMSIDIAEYFRRESDSILEAQSEAISTRHRFSRMEEARQFIAQRKRDLSMSIPLSEIPFIGLLPSARATAEARLAALETPKPGMSSTVKALLARTFFTLHEAGLRPANGEIEKIAPETGAFVVSGWTDTNETSLVLLVKGGVLVEAVSRVPRPDLEKKLGGNKDFGFVFRVPCNHVRIRNKSDVLVLAAIRDVDGLELKTVRWSSAKPAPTKHPAAKQPAPARPPDSALVREETAVIIPSMIVFS